MSEADEIVKEFLVESNENLDQLDRDLVALEKEPASMEILARIFRAIHTIKGTTGFLGFSKLEAVAHVGESLLSRLRDGVLTLNLEITSALLALVDAVRGMLASIETTGQDGDGNYATLIDRLTRLQTASPAGLAPTPPLAETSQPAGPIPLGPEAVPASVEGKISKAHPRTVSGPSPVVKPLGEILVDTGRVTREQVARAIEQQIAGDPRHLGEILVAQGAVQPAEVLEALQAQKEPLASTLGASNIRVDVGQLDKLVNLVGELVLARNQILQFSAHQQDGAFLNATKRLNLITAELQEGVMKTRMQPIDNVWSKFPRVVRDLAMACGKQVRVEMEGKETELDRTIIEAIKDPLTHIVRNSVDHGIEKPEQRLAACKPVEGRLFLRAYHEGGMVNIEVSDDGAGIPVDRVKRNAVNRGLITAGQAAGMDEHEALDLIFHAGLSTVEKVTNVSGRGVGMDVVKTNIGKIGGTVDIQSQLGRGTTVKVKIPLTLAIIPVLIVTSAGDRYAIPQISLLELVRLEEDVARKGIESIHGASVYRLHGEVLPLVYLNHQLGVEVPHQAEEADNLEGVSIAVLQADGLQFGLIVDEVNDIEEIVVKPLGKHLKGIATFLGATIMGDGQVALILDVAGIAHRANVTSEVREQDLAEAQTARSSENRQRLLLFESHDDGRMAIPLGLVTRLEEFPRSALKKAGSQEVVQCHDGILALVRLSSLLMERRKKVRNLQENSRQDAAVQVVVYSNRGRNTGLIVERILDIVEENVDNLQEATRDGIQGSVEIQGRVTEILDLEGLLCTHSARCSAKHPAQEARK